jgi:tetratricopeptide (TPR) repeat protein
VSTMLSVLRRLRETPPPADEAAGAPDLFAGAYGPAGDPSRTAAFLPPAANAKLAAPADRTEVADALDRARSRFAGGAFGEALAILDPLVPLEPRNPSVAFWRAYALRKLRRHDEAADEAGRAFSLGLRDVATRDLRMNALALAGRVEELDRMAPKDGDRLPPTADAHLALAAGRISRGRFLEGLHDLRVALRLARPGSRSHRQAVEGLETLTRPTTNAPEPVRALARAALEDARNGASPDRMTER